MIQNLLSEQHGGQSSGSVRRRASHKTVALPGPPPPVPIDPQPSEARTQVDGHLGGVGQSHSNPQSTPSDRSASRRGVRSDKDSRGPPVSDNDKGRSRPGVRPNDPKPSRNAACLDSCLPVPDPLGGPVLNVANTTQKTQKRPNPIRPGPLSFRASFHFT